MDHEAVRELFDEERRTLGHSDVTVEVAGPVVRNISRYTTQSGIAFSDLQGHDLSKVIKDEIGYFASIGHDFEWKTYSHDFPSDLVATLGKAGFSVGEAEAVLVAEVTDQAAASCDCLVEVRRLTDPNNLDDYFTARSIVSGDRGPSWIAEAMRSDPTSVGVYVAYWSGMPVASSRGSFVRGSAFSGLWGGSVLPEYRGKGVYRSMVRRRAQDALSFGARYLQVDALPGSLRILEQLGFKRLSMTTPCLWRRDAQ